MQQIPHLALGTVQIGLEYGRANTSGCPDDSMVSALLTEALESGVTLWDTARGYGNSEERLGYYLQHTSNNAPTVISKLSPLPDLAEDADKATILAAVDDSLFTTIKNLGVKKLDGLLLHRWVHRNAFGGLIWQRLLEHKENGLIDRLGMSMSMDVAEVKEALADKDVSFIQLPHNILDWRWREAGIPELCLARPDVHIQVRSSLLQGLLAAPADVWPQIDGVDPTAIVKRLEELTTDFRRQNRADLCYAYIRSLAWVNSVVVGAETVAQLQENTALFKNPPLTAAQANIIETAIIKVPEQMLNPALWNK